MSSAASTSIWRNGAGRGKRNGKGVRTEPNGAGRRKAAPIHLAIAGRRSPESASQSLHRADRQAWRLGDSKIRDLSRYFNDLQNWAPADFANSVNAFSCSSHFSGWVRWILEACCNHNTSQSVSASPPSVRSSHTAQPHAKRVVAPSRHVASGGVRTQDFDGLQIRLAKLRIPPVSAFRPRDR